MEDNCTIYQVTESLLKSQKKTQLRVTFQCCFLQDFHRI